MNISTIIKCACCSEMTDAATAQTDPHVGEVCRPCAAHLRIADSALREQGIPPVHNGPYSGNSNG